MSPECHRRFQTTAYGRPVARGLGPGLRQPPQRPRDRRPGELRLERLRSDQDRELRRRDYYQDWHRVERAKAMFELEVQRLRERGWLVIR